MKKRGFFKLNNKQEIDLIKRLPSKKNGFHSFRFLPNLQLLSIATLWLGCIRSHLSSEMFQKHQPRCTCQDATIRLSRFSSFLYPKKTWIQQKNTDIQNHLDEYDRLHKIHVRAPTRAVFQPSGWNFSPRFHLIAKGFT